jgi:cytochrome c biogenesis protein CcmG/thiol:disulfide interchange protein DsbE
MARSGVISTFGRRLLRVGLVLWGLVGFYGCGGNPKEPPAEDAAASEVSIGAEFPAFELPALDGKGSIALEDYRGRAVVLNFWASWCVPCRHEIPLLNALAAELDSQQAVVVGLNEDYDPADGLAFIQKIGGVSYANAAGEGRLVDKYDYLGLPYTVVLDRELRVVKAFFGFGESIDPIRDLVLTKRSD